MTSPSGDSPVASTSMRTSSGSGARSQSGWLWAFSKVSAPSSMRYGPPVFTQSSPSVLRSKSSDHAVESVPGAFLQPVPQARDSRLTSPKRDGRMPDPYTC